MCKSLKIILLLYQEHLSYLTRQIIEDKIEKGILQHKVVNKGEPVGKYISRYVVDLQIIPTATEIRFYADDNGKITLP